MQMSKGHMNQPEGLVAKAGRLSETLLKMIFYGLKEFPCSSDGKESACNVKRPGFNPWVGKIH